MRTGAMAAGFTASHTATSVTIGNTAKYYKYHQSSAARSSKLPRRQMAGVNGKIKDMVRDAVRADIKKKLATV